MGPVGRAVLQRAVRVVVPLVVFCGCGDRDVPRAQRQQGATRDGSQDVIVAFERVAYAFDGVTDEDAAVARLTSFSEEDLYARIAIFGSVGTGTPRRLAHGHTMRGGPSTLFLEVVVPAESITTGRATAILETIDRRGKVRFKRRLSLAPP